MNNIVKIFLLACVIFTFNSCKQKGCMDPKSLNYDVTAEEDDGSCVYCESTVTQIGYKAQFLVDNYGGSIHYLDNIVKFEFIQHEDKYNFVQCGNTGCFIDLKLTSLINETIELDYNIYSQAPYINFGESITLSPQTTHTTKINSTQTTDCFPISNANVTIQLVNPPFYY